MHNGVDLVLGQQRSYIGIVAYVAFDKQIARIGCNVREIVDVARIGQRVEHDHPPLPSFSQPVVYEVRTDEARSSGNEYVTRLEAHPTSSLDCAASESRAA